MELKGRVSAIIVIVLIFLFCIIHLGVGGGVISRFHSYGDVFRPEQGLSVYNIIMSIFGIIISLIGLVAIITRQSLIGKIAFIGLVILAVLTFISLIAALAINSLAISYASNHFTAYMNRYSMNEYSQQVVDRIQADYQCCGDNLWMDWASRSIHLNMSIIPTTTTSTTSTTSATSDTATTESSTTSTTNFFSGLGAGSRSTTSNFLLGFFTPVIGNTDSSTSFGFGSQSSSTTQNSWLFGLGQGLSGQDSTPSTTTNVFFGKLFEDYYQSYGKRAASQLAETVRGKRQLSSSSNNIFGFPSSYIVNLPQSCCSASGSASLNSYCTFISDNPQNNIFFQQGCAKTLGQLAVGQSLAFAVINSFLIVLSIVAIPVLRKSYSAASRWQKRYRHESLQNVVPTHAYGGLNNIDTSSKLSVNNPHIDYSLQS